MHAPTRFNLYSYQAVDEYFGYVGVQPMNSTDLVVATNVLVPDVLPKSREVFVPLEADGLQKIWCGDGRLQLYGKSSLAKKQLRPGQIVFKVEVLDQCGN